MTSELARALADEAEARGLDVRKVVRDECGHLLQPRTVARLADEAEAILRARAADRPSWPPRPWSR